VFATVGAERYRGRHAAHQVALVALTVRPNPSLKRDAPPAALRARRGSPLSLLR